LRTRGVSLRGRPSFIRFLAGGVVALVFQEPAKVGSGSSVLLSAVGLPPGEARLRRLVLALEAFEALIAV
jgi:hypothetical protein